MFIRPQLQNFPKPLSQNESWCPLFSYENKIWFICKLGLFSYDVSATGVGDWDLVTCFLLESTWQVKCDQKKNNKLCTKVLQISEKLKIFKNWELKSFNRSKTIPIIRSISSVFAIKFYPVDNSYFFVQVSLRRKHLRKNEFSQHWSAPGCVQTRRRSLWPFKPRDGQSLQENVNSDHGRSSRTT